MMNLEGYGRKQLRSIDATIYLEGLWETTVNLSQDSRPRDDELNLGTTAFIVVDI
jgi:hypothetical protein